MPESPPACGPALGTSDGHRFVAAFCDAFEEHALSAIEADGMGPLTPLAPLALSRATPLAVIGTDVVAQLMAVASGQSSAPMPRQQLEAMNTLIALHQMDIAKAALATNGAGVNELRRANERLETKDATAEAAAAVATLHSKAADALLTALIVAAAFLAIAGWRTVRSLPRAIRDCTVQADLHRYDPGFAPASHFPPADTLCPAFSPAEASLRRCCRGPLRFRTSSTACLRRRRRLAVPVHCYCSLRCC